jgi:hypothetical protein
MMTVIKRKIRNQKQSVTLSDDYYLWRGLSHSGFSLGVLPVVAANALLWPAGVSFDDCEEPPRWYAFATVDGEPLACGLTSTQPTNARSREANS